jgi:hypothetical protein
VTVQGPFVAGVITACLIGGDYMVMVATEIVYIKLQYMYESIIIIIIIILRVFASRSSQSDEIRFKGWRKADLKICMWRLKIYKLCQDRHGLYGSAQPRIFNHVS